METWKHYWEYLVGAFGGLTVLVMGFIKADAMVNDKIHRQATDIIDLKIAEQRLACAEQMKRVIQDSIENSPRFAKIEECMDNMENSVDKLLQLHLNGGGKNQ